MATKKSNKSLWLMLALIVAIIAALFLLPACGGCTKSTADDTEATTLVKTGDMAPDFTVTMFDTEKVSLLSLRGKVVLIGFFATWCPPCREEMSHVQREIIDRFADADFVFLPISRGETRDAVAEFREKNGYDFPMGLDPQQTIFGLYATNFIPRNFLIDANGKVVLTSVGYDDTEFKHLIQTIEQTLQKQ